MATGAELNYNVNANATAMAEAMFGSGVTVVGASHAGPGDSPAARRTLRPFEAQLFIAMADKAA